MLERNVRRSSLFSLAIGAMVAVIGGITPGQADDCAPRIQQFNDAVDAGQEGKARDIVDQISVDGQCGHFQVPMQRRLAALRLRLAQDLMAKGRPSDEYERILSDAARPGVLWQAAATLAEVRFGQRRFAEAALGFDSAIEAVKNDSVTPTAPSKAEIQELIDRAALARILEANTGSNHASPTYVTALDDHRSGLIGGYFSPSVRGIVPHALPLPIIFDFNQATLTPVGQDAARELSRAIREQKLNKVVVVGHTDIRGEAEYNLKLSRDRANAVADFLRRDGVDASIQASGVGSTEPIKLEESSGLTQDDIYALNRRVEWLRD